MCEWYKSFKSGRQDVNDLSRTNTPRTAVIEENIAKMKELVLENRRYSLRELA